jgi:hypothetical protein
MVPAGWCLNRYRGMEGTCVLRLSAAVPPCDQREELCLVHRGWQLFRLFFYAYFIRYLLFPIYMEADEVRALLCLSLFFSMRWKSELMC